MLLGVLLANTLYFTGSFYRTSGLTLVHVVVIFHYVVFDENYWYMCAGFLRNDATPRGDARADVLLVDDEPRADGFPRNPASRRRRPLPRGKLLTPMIDTWPLVSYDFWVPHIRYN